MNKVFAALVFCLSLSTLGLYAQETQKISMIENDMKTLRFSFECSNFQQMPPDKIISVQYSEDNKSQLTITALEPGECTLQVNGMRASVTYVITVLSNVRKTLSRLRTDLQELTELDVSMNQDVINIRGTINSPEKWRQLQSILGGYDDKLVKSFVKFKPSADTLLGLKKTLEELGYTFAETRECEPGQLFMTLAPNGLLFYGAVYSEGERSEIMELLANESWLAIDSAPDASLGQIKALVKLNVIPSQIAVDVAFIGLTKSDADRLSSDRDNPLAVNFDFSRIYDWVAGRTTGNTGIIGATLGGTVKYLADNGITRIHQAGTVTFTSASSTGGNIRVGGTTYVPVSGDSNGDLKEITYGFNVNITGTQLNRHQISMHISVENSHMIDDLHKQEQNMQTDRICEMDQTTILGGFQGIEESISKSGLPVLRNIPVLQWFAVSKGGNAKSKETTHLLILISPRIAVNDPKATIKTPVTQAATEELFKAEGDERTAKDVEEEKKRFHGFWSWLNWFTW